MVPGLAFILSMVVIEGMLLKGRRIRQVFSAMLLFFCSNTTSLFATGALTELFKTVSSSNSSKQAYRKMHG